MNPDDKLRALMTLANSIKELYMCQLFPEVKTVGDDVLMFTLYTYAEGRLPENGESPLQGERMRLNMLKIIGNFDDDYFILSVCALNSDHMLHSGTYNEINRFLQRKIMEKKLTK
jgi:hypothetical protein